MLKKKNMKILSKVPLLGLTFLFSLMLAAVLSMQFSPSKATADESKRIVGSWYVDAIGAPFVPHVMQFYTENSFIIHNPDAGNPSTSDSLGVGPWKKVDNDTIKGKFIEPTADRTTHQFVNNLVVTFEVTVDGDTFSGPAEARYYDANWNLLEGPYPATLNGKRITFTSLP
jgi:hypothetical protein